MLIKCSIYMILLSFSIFSGVVGAIYSVGLSHKKEAVFDKKQDKGPVYNPLRVKPYTKKEFKA